MEKALDFDFLFAELQSDILIAFYSIESQAGMLRKDHPELRKGQAIYTIASDLFPATTKHLDSEVDCFYVDSKIEIFLHALSEQLIKDNKM